MTRTYHDRFAKHLLAGLLNQVGQAEPQHEIPGEVRAADLWFVASPVPQKRRDLLGWLGRMARTDCLIEAFSGTPSDDEIRDCLGKLFDVHRALRRKARREHHLVSRISLPSLWVLSPSGSRHKLGGFGALTKACGGAWPEGVYFLPKSFKTAVVVLNQLPKTPETVFLRLLGKGETRTHALEAAGAFPLGHPGQKLLWELMEDLPTETRRPSMRMSKDDALFLKDADALYKAWQTDLIQKGLQKGLKKGLKEGQFRVVQILLRTRFGVLDPELEQIVEPLLALSEDEMGREILERSREELLARFGTPKPPSMKKTRIKK